MPTTTEVGAAIGVAVGIAVCVLGLSYLFYRFALPLFMAERKVQAKLKPTASEDSLASHGFVDVSVSPSTYKATAGHSSSTLFLGNRSFSLSAIDEEAALHRPLPVSTSCLSMTSSQNSPTRKMTARTTSLVPSPPPSPLSKEIKPAMQQLQPASAALGPRASTASLAASYLAASQLEAALDSSFEASFATANSSIQEERD